jgi:hypothetical protein
MVIRLTWVLERWWGEKKKTLCFTMMAALGSLIEKSHTNAPSLLSPIHTPFSHANLPPSAFHASS